MNNQKMSIKDALDKYKGAGQGGGFFSLKTDGEYADVRFLYGDNPNTLDWFPLYVAKIDGKERKIVQNHDNDPLSRVGKPVLKGIFQLVKVEEGKVDYTDDDIMIWERGRVHIEALMVAMNTNGALKDLTYRVQRSGARGDKNTTYTITPIFKNAEVKDGFAKLNLPAGKELLQGKKGFILQLTDAEQEQVINGTIKLKDDSNTGNNNGATMQSSSGAAYNPFSQPSTNQPTTPATTTKRQEF